MKIFTPVLLLAAMALSVPAHAANLTYPEMIKIIGTNKNVKGKLVGQTATLKLRATGPDSLVVNAKDMTFFECAKRSPAFAKAGTVTAKISNYSEDQDGNPVITLDNCAS